MYGRVIGYWKAHGKEISKIPKFNLKFKIKKMSKKTPKIDPWPKITKKRCSLSMVALYTIGKLTRG